MTKLQESVQRLQASLATTRQQKIANAIREVPALHVELGQRLIHGNTVGTAYDALAAACHDDAIWDAICQVRQVVVLERGR